METNTKNKDKRKASKGSKVKRFSMVKWDGFIEDMNALKAKYDEIDANRAIKKAVKDILSPEINA